jgi:group II intron reverse transcriptase/maturase/CRISPR-associated endonuclease Cas1
MPELSTLSWKKISLTMVNTRQSDRTKSHILSRIEAITKEASKALSYSPDETGRAVFFHIFDKPHGAKIRKDVPFPVEVVFTGFNDADLDCWLSALKSYLAGEEGGKNFSLVGDCSILTRSYESVLHELQPVKTSGEVCLDFLVPVPFRLSKGRQRTYIDKNGFIDLFTRRIKRLFGEEVEYHSDSDSFSILPYYWYYFEIKRQSVSQSGSTQFINGCAGHLYLKGKFEDFLPFLVLGSELHAGPTIANSQGYYNLLFDSPGHFSKFFPSREGLLAITRDVLEKYDHAAEQMTIEFGAPFDEKSFADKISNEIREGRYVPSPAKAFTIQRKSGGERTLEQLSFRDLIVQEYILQVFSESAERVFEEQSIGFRKGASRETTIEMIRKAIADGYRFVIESDIEDFFPSVGLDILDKLLDFYLPEKDGVLKSIIRTMTRNGYVLNGAYHDRTKGLGQGSPLSPVLANLYLQSFDESTEKWGVRMIRYADDFIILTKSKEQAESTLAETAEYLSEIGLRLKKEKTCVKSVQDGFQFLGIKFTGSEVEVTPEEEIKLFRKPLYITEPYLFLSVNGEAIDIKKGGGVVETIPIRRISEIMVMEKSTFSTYLVQKCIENGIPLTITLGSGYYVTTVKPDSKKYYDVVHYHTQKYNSLGETELLSYAKEIAAGKLRNYAALFAQKYESGQNLFLRRIDEYIRKINSASDANEVRGLEGASAKEIFQKLNSVIDVSDFHILSRNRIKPDRINSMLNFAYYLLFARLNATVRAVGLNPYLGFLHSPEDNYESLVSDLVELFRARIDRFLARLINLKIISAKDFVETDRGFFLTRDANKKFLEQFEMEMEKKGGVDRLTLKESMYVQVQVVRRWVLENGTLSFYTWQV